MIEKIRNNKKLIFLYLITLVLLAGINFIYHNYYILKSDDNNKGIIKLDLNDFKYSGFEIKDNKLVSTKDKAKIVINFDRYVNKLNFDYNSTNNLSIKEKIQYYNTNGLVKVKKSSSANYYGLETYTKTINKNIRTITLTFDDENIEVSNFYIKNEVSFNYYTFIFLALIFLNLYLIIFKRNYFSKNLEKGFLLVSLSVGFLITIVMPPVVGTSFDDQIHFKHAYELFDKDGKNTAIVEDYKDLKLNFSMFDTQEERKAIVDLVNDDKNLNDDYQTAEYLSFRRIPHVPAATVIKVCNLLNLPFILTYILGKSINILIYSLIMYFAIKIIPVHKHLFTYIALIPTTIFISAQYSYDNMVTPFLALAFSIFIYEMYNKDNKINRKLIMVFLLSLFVACTAKAIYAPIVLLLLLLPKKKFENSKKSKIFKIGIILLCTILIATAILPNVTSNTSASDPRGGDTSVSRQAELIIKKPIHFTVMFIKNVGSGFSGKFFSPGALLSYSYFGTTKIHNIVYPLLFGLMFFAITDTSKKKYLNKFQKLFIAFTILIIICMIWGTLFLSFTPVGDTAINGVQARYFLPLLMPLLICFSSNNISHNIKNEKYTCILFIISIFSLYFSVYFEIISQYCL